MSRDHPNELKRQYNKLLIREQRAEQWIDAPSRTEQEYLKWLPEFQKILNGLNEILNKIGVSNTTENERSYGFKRIQN